MSENIQSTPVVTDKVEDMLTHICNYLEASGWTRTQSGLFYIDPIVKTKHCNITALQTQLERDLQKEQFGDW